MCIRDRIRFGYQKIIGYVENVEETHFSKSELEQRAGFRYQYILDVIDEEPLLNEELQTLANQLSRMTLSPRISCLQAMLPTQLKPSTHQTVGIKTQQVVHLVEGTYAKTIKQQECMAFLQEHPDIPVKDIPYSRALLCLLYTSIVWRPGHVGIYVGGGRVIHSPTTGSVVSYTSLSGFTCGVRY